jgi:glutaredoxin 2
VVLSPLPIVYNYDHCPFCVRVRLALGLKSVKYTPFFLANDDVPTPTALIGKKIAPIFTGYDGVPVGESMDIVKAIDADPK